MVKFIVKMNGKLKMQLNISQQNLHHSNLFSVSITTLNFHISSRRLNKIEATFSMSRVRLSD